MKSKPYKLHGKLFRYDFDLSVVEYIAKATDEDIADEEEWKEKYGKPLLGIDADGYMIISTVGLHKNNWKSKAARDEYLYQWCCELDEESSALASDFVKYELPFLSGGGDKK